MIKIIAVGALAVAIGAGTWWLQNENPKPSKPVSIPVAAGIAAPARLRREQMARLVAETAAATAEKTTREMLARKAEARLALQKQKPQQTAAR